MKTESEELSAQAQNAKQQVEILVLQVRGRNGLSRSNNSQEGKTKTAKTKLSKSLAGAVNKVKIEESAFQEHDESFKNF